MRHKNETKELEGYIYLCKYKNADPFIDVYGNRELLIQMLIDAINTDELFFAAIDYCANKYIEHKQP